MRQEQLLQIITDNLEGEFDNFQQCWQENTEEEIHRVEISEKHRLIHSISKKLSPVDQACIYFKLSHSENRKVTQIIDEQIIRFSINKKEGVIYSEHFAVPAFDDLTQLGPVLEKLTWTSEADTISGISSSGNSRFKLENDVLEIRQQEGIFRHTVTDYRMIKCRFFAGWIEYPSPENPEDVYRMGDLVLHDQGGIIPLTFSDGQKGKYVVELTQLIFAKTLPIMKLAIYEEPFEEIDYNSKAISYTWTNPESKRLGINLRKVLTGWTFIEPGYFSSNHLQKEKDEG